MHDSYFDGGVISLIGLWITTWLICVFTLGIGFPWAMCRYFRWEVNHTVVDGRRLQFDGTATSLFLHWIKWFFLMIITLGIYGLWMRIRLKQWKTQHISFAA
ncbi:MAG: DUF898 domain-containing protein [Erysipelotrichaceae bacterium]|jgi:uncharacterized membrane protein YjgN (DUF898 family)|nr:DUF898 domain-containing protein [Erysipelotrichaceae bacterium]